jgi:hypothetical protein
VRLNNNSARTYIAALLISLSLGAPIAAKGRAAAAPSTANAVDVSTIRIDNFGRVDSMYYRGAQPQGRDYADLAALGVKTMINLTSDDAEPNEQSMAEQAGMKYFQIPIGLSWRAFVPEEDSTCCRG